MIIDNVFCRQPQRIFLLCTAIALMLQFSGCVVTSNFYSGRVVEEGKFAVTTGLDNIYIKSNTGSIEVSDKSPYAPSMALAYGFPLRIEGNLRFMPPRFFEFTLRHQVNPPSFDFVDGSLNVHFGHFFGGYSYVKYGATLSKDIYGFEPSVHYSGYSFLGASTSDISGGISSSFTDDFINMNRVIGFGIGIPLKKAKFFPVVDYQYFGSIDRGLWHFGVGLRVPFQ